MIYADNNRGKIQNRERGRQIIDFSKIRYGNITPTDLDGFFEQGNKIFVFYEYKLPDVEMPRGQRLALMRIVDGLSTAGKSAVLFLCRHEAYNPEVDIQADKAIVEKIYWNNQWFLGKGLTAKEQTDKFIQWANSLGSDKH
ncbi:MAG: hypothetical protein IJ587_00015 [Synergistaceae bacterium]|nr:hypothetical protein [Synergistaceae bacterium]